MVTEKSAVAKKDHAVPLQDLRLASGVPSVSITASLSRRAPACRSAGAAPNSEVKQHLPASTPLEPSSSHRVRSLLSTCMWQSQFCCLSLRSATTNTRNVGAGAGAEKTAVRTSASEWADRAGRWRHPSSPSGSWETPGNDGSWDLGDWRHVMHQ